MIDTMDILGIINLTPNSFSDQKKFLDQKKLISTIQQFLTIKSLAFDFGFESTAPFNQPITEEEERLRFDLFFEEIQELDLSGRFISFDTYKINNYLYFEKKFKSRYKNCHFILNDISGVVDSSLIDLLIKKKSDKTFYYVFSFSHIPERSHVLKHMDFVKEGNILEMAIDHFKNGIATFKHNGINLEHIIIDLGFGFSKSYQQNWDLINQMDELLDKMEELSFFMPMVIGLSKKSFLRKALPIDSKDPFLDSEILHELIIKELNYKKRKKFIIRAHDPFLVQSALF